MYNEICNFSSIKRAFYSARHGKINNSSANRFEINLLAECLCLSDELKNRTYKTGRSTKFKVYHPKERDIESSTFRDKVVQHSYCDNLLYPTICNSLIYDNYASQLGKGTAFGINRLKKHLRHYFFLNKAKNEELRKKCGLPLLPVEQCNYADGWILKCDIRKFFSNIDHSVVKEKLRELFKDNDILWLSDKIIDSISTNKERANVGLPLGYQSSQLYSLLLLNDLDHLIKEKLHIKGYGRYVDDFYLIHKDKNYLKYCLKIIKEYLSKYNLELNNKTQIFPIKNGIDFLGFHTYMTNSGKVICKIRKSSKENIKRRLRKLSAEYNAGKISLQQVIEIYGGWRAHAQHGDTYHLIKNIDNYYKKLFNANFEQKGKNS